MGALPLVLSRTSWLRQTAKIVAVAASTGAALVSVVTALYSYGVIGKAESHQSIGNLGAAWVGVQPSVETATSIGDTVHFAATIADKNGSILVGARPMWTTGDTNVARVLPDGSVIARGAGATTISVVVGTRVARARVLVKPKVSVVQLDATRGDSGAVIAEGGQLALRARALDERGHAVIGAAIQWQVDDSTIAYLDTTGMLIGRNAGRTELRATADGIATRLGVTVVTTASSITLAAGASQRVLAGAALPQAIVVRAIDHRGAPASGQTVTFRPRDGDGSVEPRTARTDADGRARANWTLGAYPGRQTLFASVEHLDSALAIIAEADPVPSNTRVIAVSDRLSGEAGVMLSDSASVRVTDSTGRALADIPVRWTTLDGGSAQLIASRTDSLGMARVRWTLARSTGIQRLRAEVGGTGSHGIAPVTLTARALAGAPSEVRILSGNGQRAAAGSALRKDIVLRVVDATGNGVGDVPLTLSPSGGTIPDSVLHTDSLGIVSTRWVLGHAARSYALAVRVDGIPSLIKLNAQATPSSPANLSFDDAPSSAHGAKTRHLYALATDVYGNPVSETRVSFSASSGVVTPSRAVSDVKGRVAIAWTPGTKAGEQTLTGRIRGTDVTGSYVASIISAAAPSSAVPSRTRATSSGSAVHRRAPR